MSSQGTPHGGILYRGATGELWFMRDDHQQPTRIKNSALEMLVEGYAKKASPDEFIGSDLPQDILDILNDLFGPLVGAWWVWGP